MIGTEAKREKTIIHDYNSNNNNYSYYHDYHDRHYGIVVVCL